MKRRSTYEEIIVKEVCFSITIINRSIINSLLIIFLFNKKIIIFVNFNFGL